MSETSYLFVDGAYLRMALQTLAATYFPERVIEVNPWGLFSGFKKGFYYDCLPAQLSSETEEQFQARFDYQKRFFRLLRDRPGVHVVEGVIKGSRNRRQKKIDVSITVDMLSHAYHRNMDKVTLFAGDLDFLPVVEALVRDGMYVTLWYEESSVSEELIYAADERRILNISNVFEIMTDDCRQNLQQPREDSRRKRQYTVSPMKVGMSANGLKFSFYANDGQFDLVSTSSDQSEYEGCISYQLAM